MWVRSPSRRSDQFLFAVPPGTESRTILVLTSGGWGMTAKRDGSRGTSSRQRDRSSRGTLALAPREDVLNRRVGSHAADTGGDGTRYIVIPTFNERSNLEPLVRSIARFMGGERFRILVVDDGSVDGTRGVAEALAAQGFPVALVNRGSKRGIGSAVRDGLKWCLARGDVTCIVTMDADMSHDPADLPRLVLAASRADLVQGSRYADGGSARNRSLARRFLSLAANSVVRLLLRTGMREHTTYFRVYSPEAARVAASVQDTDGYEWAVGSLAAVLRESLSVEEVPIHFGPRGGGSSKMTPTAVVLWAYFVLRLVWGPSLSRSSLIRLTRFAVVGLFGLAVSQVVLYLLHGVAGWGSLLALLVAIESSIVSNFLINDRWTFRDRGRSVSTSKRLVRFHGSCLVGVVLNVSLFAVLTLGIGLNYLLANVFAIIAGFLANFQGSTVWTWVKG